MTGGYRSYEKAQHSLLRRRHLGSMDNLTEDPFVHMAATEGGRKVVKVQLVKCLSELRPGVIAQLNVHASLVKQTARVSVGDRFCGKLCMLLCFCPHDATSPSRGLTCNFPDRRSSDEAAGLAG